MEQKQEIFAIKIPISQLKKLRDEPKFILILRLGRYINQLSFCQKSYLDIIDNETPVSLRQTHNSFLFSCAILYEALKIIPDLGKEFRTFKAFSNGFAKLSKDKDLNFLKQKVLNKMRNEFIYHVDAKPYQNILKTYNLRRIDFLTSTSDRQGDIYFQLADELALNYIIGDHGTAEAEREYYQETVAKIMRVMVEFILRSNELIKEYVDRKCWKVDIKPSL